MKNTFKRIDSEDIIAFQKICGESHVLLVSDETRVYGTDQTEDLFFPPEVILRPGNTEEVSAILSRCNEQRIPVTTRGAGTGLSGGALPVAGGVVLSMERMSRILEIDRRNLQARVQPGVITQVFQEEVLQYGLFYPPDPSSRGSCFLGGNIAHNSGGPRAVKYGVTRDFVLSLQVVMADGSVIQTGASTLKNSTGYSLTQLMVGSEGTLGVVTEITVKLLPAPTRQLLMLVPFSDAEQACEAVSAVFSAGIIPSAMEFMERDAIDFTLKHVAGIQIQVPDHVKAHLLIELDGVEGDNLETQAERVFEVVQKFGAGEVLLADSEAEKNQLWKLRRSVAEAVRAHSVYKEEDTVVPRAELPLLLKTVKEIGKKYGFDSVCYGHAGDGNLHVNILRGKLGDSEWETILPKAIAEIFACCKKLKGTLSGEHGVGWVQRQYLPIVMGKTEMDLMRGIKMVFDPVGILNPSKIFPESMAAD